MTEGGFVVADFAVWQQAVLSILAAYVLCQAIAGVYVLTHRGANYSRSLVISLVAAGLVSAVLMLAIGNNLARGLGIVGTLALIRFRTNLYDPLDMLYIFASFGVGVATGSGNFATGTIGAAGFLLVVATLQLSGFGSRHHHDGVVRLQLPVGGDESALVAALTAHCKDFAAVSVREVAQGRAQERVYQVSFKAVGQEGALVGALAALPGASGVSVAMQEATHEL
ncbi:MAG: DUF4956 domain-containing protein [Myxococcales bacterium]